MNHHAFQVGAAGAMGAGVAGVAVGADLMLLHKRHLDANHHTHDAWAPFMHGLAVSLLQYVCILQHALL